MKSLKLFSIIAITAMLAACTGKNDPTVVKFESAAEKSVSVNGNLDFVVKVKVTNEQGKTTIVQTGTLPEGVTFTDNGDKTAKLAGSPTTAGTYVITFTASNNGVSTSQEFTLKVSEGGTGNDGDGSETNPYLVSQVLELYAADPYVQENDKWVGGYIVGGVANNISNGQDNDGQGTNNVIAKAEDVVFGTIGVRPSAVLIANNANETDYRKCLIVQISSVEGQTPALPEGFQDKVNLNNAPCNIGKFIKVQGDFYRYFAVPAVRRIMAFDFPDYEPCPPPSGGTITVAEARTKSSGIYTVIGYIVGGVIDDCDENGQNCGINTLQGHPEGYVWAATGVRSTCVFLADSPNETNPANVIIAKLNDNSVNPSNLRSSLNLKDNPCNYKTEVTVTGTIQTYFGVPGVRNLTAFTGGGLGTSCN